MKPAITVVIPSYNTPAPLLKRLADSLKAQTLRDFEVIIVDDKSSSDHYALLDDPRLRVIFKDSNTGPADTRNAGAAAAAADVIFFTDADCELAPGTLEAARRLIQGEDALMGNTVTRAATFVGRAVAFMGFPGGGSIGFDRVWEVDAAGYTNSVSSCNFAVRKRAFLDTGGFDRAFPVPGGEDTVFGKTFIRKGYRIKYAPEQLVYHVERESLAGFARWQVTRGRGNYHIRKRLGSVGGFLRLRLWSFGNSLRAAGPLYAPFVAGLFALSAACQMRGYKLEKSKDLRHENL